MDYRIIIYAILGILPSLIWLFYYLNKDLHPEPKRMILEIFLWGALITLPVVFVQLGTAKILDIITWKLGFPHLDYIHFPFPYLDHLLALPLANLSGMSLAIVVTYWFLIIAFSEELFKYLIIKIKVINNPNLDEPLDVMLYMTVAALGFAAVENIFYLLSTIGQMSFDTTFTIYIVRFLGAIFLHTLCSAVIGYALAISFYEVRRRKLCVFAGITVAVILHGLFDFSMILLPYPANYAVPVVIILTLAFLTYVGFEKLKKMKSICKIQ